MAASLQQFLIGHRGAMGLAPENTLKSFRIGCENGADVLECDVHLTRDGQLVVIHDATIKRTTNGKGRVRRFTVEQIQQFDAGDGEKIPTLLEVVELITSYDKKLIVEIKGKSRKSAVETANALADFIRTHDLADRIIVYSFSKVAVRIIKEKVPEVSAAVLYARILRVKQVLKTLQRVGADGVSIAYQQITEDMVNLLDTHGLFVDAWVMNDLPAFEEMRGMGVRGLSTDFPGTLS